jgi:hypothetical protein
LPQNVDLRFHAFLALVFAALAAAAIAAQERSTPAAAPDPAMEAVQRFSKGEYLAAIDALERAAFDSSGNVTNRSAYQMWYQLRPLIGGHASPPVLAPGAPPLSPDDAKRLSAAESVDALASIRSAGLKTRIVILNEAHHSPRDRAFALEVARTLRPLGYTILAAEAFSNPDAAKDSPVDRMARDGYPRLDSGHYTNDPVFADFVRQALVLGFRPAAYEQKRSQSVPGGGIAAREQAQAENIAKLMAANPEAKVFAYVGFSHVLEAPVDGDMEWMAARLKKLTGIDPLTIDQANLGEASMHRWGREAQALVATRIRKASVLRLGGAFVKVGKYAHAVDLQVFQPRTHLIQGRPSWLKQTGRTAQAVPSNLLPSKGRRLIQAFLADEGEGAIPIDQVLVEAGKPVPSLMLPERPVRYAVQN